MESQITQSNVNGSLVPSGALLSLIEKGLHYTEAEISIGDVCDCIPLRVASIPRFSRIQDGSERMVESLSLIDSVMPLVIENRKNLASKQQMMQLNTESNNMESQVADQSQAMVGVECTTSSLSNSNTLTESEEIKLSNEQNQCSDTISMPSSGGNGPISSYSSAAGNHTEPPQEDSIHSPPTHINHNNLNSIARLTQPANIGASSPHHTYDNGVGHAAMSNAYMTLGDLH